MSVGCVASLSHAIVLNPVYTNTFLDAVTGNNDFMSGGNRYWNIDGGADVYQQDVYERPTAQTYTLQNGLFAASEYHEYLDITQASVGLDSRFMYVRIDLFGRDKSTTDGVNTPVGLTERYGFRFSTDPDGRNGYFLTTESPETQIVPPDEFGTHATLGSRDTDADVGGRGIINGHPPSGLFVTKTDNPWEEVGMNGYDDDFISDGELRNGNEVLFARIDPSDNTAVELALDYTRLGLTMQDMLDIQYLDFEALKGGPGDAQNYLWNDKYTFGEAGSPYGAKGLGSVYELDTLRGGLIPAPGALALLGLALVLGRSRRSRD